MPAFPYESCFQRVDQESIMNHFAHRAAKAIKISRNFSTAREWFRTPRGGRGRLLQHGQTSKLVTVLGFFSAKDFCRRRRDAKPPPDVMAESGEGAELDEAWAWV